MTVIATADALADYCRRLVRAPFITVDTEFMRETTYWPILCLVQIGGPDEAVAVDPLAEGMDLKPLFEILTSPDVLKVFHSARQDIEIFYNLSGEVPAPIFDTQVAAMVCGFGDAVAYETLAWKLARGRIDKTLRFTDWSRRPLTERQIQYAISDVTHLRLVYERLRDALARNGREHWLEEEMAALVNPANYDFDPREAWRRLKIRRMKPRALGILREAAAWREREAQRRDIPRQRIIRDESLFEIANHPPRTAKELAAIRGMNRGLANNPAGDALLEAIARVRAMDESELPAAEDPWRPPEGLGPVVELLKVLLKIRCEEHQVAPKLVATVGDLERLAAAADEESPLLHGWRREIFGEAALGLMRGELALTARGRSTAVVPLGGKRGRRRKRGGNRAVD